MIAIRKAGIRTCPATAIAIGAIKAVEAILPGPIDESMNDNRKNIIGITPTLPLQKRTAFCAIRSSVPLACASAKSKVTPASVTKRRGGNPSITSRGVISAKYTPTIHAKEIARNPTCSRIVQLIMMVMSPAPSERVDASMKREYIRGSR